MSDERRAVLVSLDQSEGTVRLRLDDVVADGSAGRWRQDVHVTHKSYERKVIENIELSDKELAEFGYYILARLNAFEQK